MDPAAAGKPRLPIIRRSSEIKVPAREKRYVFDKAYDGNTDNRTLYNGTVKASICSTLAICEVWQGDIDQSATCTDMRSVQSCCSS